MIKLYNYFVQKLAGLIERKCKHENLYPDMRLQMKMMQCGHFLIHGHWECRDCHEWIMLEMEDEWEGREGRTTKDGKYQFQIVDGVNKMVG